MRCAMIMLSTSIAMSLHGARAATATTASPGCSSAGKLVGGVGREQIDIVRGERPEPLRLAGADASTTAPPTKPPAPITTTRAGSCGVALSVASALTPSRVSCAGAAERVVVKPGCRGRLASSTR